MVGVSEKLLTFDAEVGLYKELRTLDSYTYSVSDVPEMICLVQRHHLPLQRFVTHRFLKSDAPEALEVFARGHAGKVVPLNDAA